MWQQSRHRGSLTLPIISVFDPFETLVTFAAVIIVNYAISDARTHWLEGLILIVIYVIIGLSIWYVLFNPSFTRAFAHRISGTIPASSPQDRVDER